ncbi:DUF3293 domain-containing protein [Myxococcota bacterium]|nr:DUF3293 domain-containing protein [Myxococcota bacterium]
MPLAPETLGWYSTATITLSPRDAEPLALPAAGETPRPPLPSALRPSAWIVPAWDPRAEPALDAEARERAERQLLTSVGQAGLASVPAALTGPDGVIVPAVALLGVDRARALRLGYKRGVWAVIGLSADRAVVVFTGINSRQRLPEE